MDNPYIENSQFYKKFNIDDLMPSNIDSLILNNVFTKSEKIKTSFPVYFNDKKFNFKPKNTDFELTKFDTIYYISDIEYSIGIMVLKEIFSTLEVIVEADTQFIEASILINLEGKLTKEDKLTYLNKKHEEFFCRLVDCPEFLIYMNISELNGFESWNELVFEMLKSNSRLVEKYLTVGIGIQDLQDDWIKDWEKFSETKKVIEFCKEKINEIKLNKTKQTPQIKSKLIFKDNGFDVFNFVVENYSGKKNPAFFSYLYFYLKSKNKIAVFGDDNITYREFIMKEFSIDSFRRIIKSPAYIQDTKEKLENHFDEILKSYSDKN